MLPTTHGPVLMPMPTFIGRKCWPCGLGLARRSALSRSSASSMRSAASQAFASWSASSSGAFQNAMMASPMYLSIVPLRSTMAFVSGVRQPVHQGGEALRVVLVVLGDGGEAAHVR